MRHLATASSRDIKRLLEIASVIIHGSETTMDQTEVAALLGNQ